MRVLNATSLFSMLLSSNAYTCTNTQRIISMRQTCFAQSAQFLYTFFFRQCCALPVHLIISFRFKQQSCSPQHSRLHFIASLFYTETYTNGTAQTKNSFLTLILFVVHIFSAVCCALHFDMAIFWLLVFVPK